MVQPPAIAPERQDRLDRVIAMRVKQAPARIILAAFQAACLSGFMGWRTAVVWTVFYAALQGAEALWMN